MYTERYLESFPHSAALLEAEPDELAPLVRSSTRERISRLARSVPLPVQTACYEARLGASNSRVDLALCVFPGISSTALAAITEEHGSDPSWARAVEFLEKWNEPSRQLEVPFVWLAFDLDEGQRSLPSPCLGLCVDPGFFQRRLGLGIPGTVPVPELVRLAREYFEELHGEAMPDRCVGLLERCLDGDVLAKHYSYMLGRSPATFKVDVRLPVRRVASYLQHVGWRADLPRLDARIRELMPWDGEIQLNLVLHPELRGPLEVEFMTQAEGVSSRHRSEFMARLTALGLCDPGKADVLRRSWEQPRGLLDDGRPYARSWYVKVRFEAEEPVEAKVYLGLIARQSDFSTSPAS